MSMEAIRDEELQIDPVTQAINVWASVSHHRLAGGYGSPKLERCGIAVDLAPEPRETSSHDRDRGVLVWDADKADKHYDASFAKYKERGPRGLNIDKRSQTMYLTVESVLRSIGNPPILIGLLLWKYPTDGDLVVKRPSNWDAENPYRSYRPRRWTLATFGVVQSKYLDRSIDRLLINMEAGFKITLAAALAGKRVEAAAGL